MQVTTKKNRWCFSLLLIVFFGPLVSAYWLYHYHRAWFSSTTNHGTLITPPLPLAELPLQVINSQQRVTDALWRHRWLLLYTHGANCETLCHQTLQQLTQVRKALGKDALRIQIVSVQVLSPGQIATSENLPAIFIWQVDKRALQTFLLPISRYLAQKPIVYLVDPLGNVLMWYYQPASRALYNDLKRVLSLSTIG